MGVSVTSILLHENNFQLSQTSIIDLAIEADAGSDTCPWATASESSCREKRTADSISVPSGVNSPSRTVAWTPRNKQSGYGHGALPTYRSDSILSPVLLAPHAQQPQAPTAA